jgi:hypothetical protein
LFARCGLGSLKESLHGFVEVLFRFWPFAIFESFHVRLAGSIYGRACNDL